MLTPIWHIPEIPFIFRPLDTPDNPMGIPNTLPFTLAFDETTGRIAQMPAPEVARALDEAYVCGSEIPGMMEDAGIGRQYAEDFIKTLESHLGRPFGGMRILEIGCGTGYLLKRLSEEGAEVLGVEPGHQSGQNLSGVRIVRGFFPCEGVHGAFDLIIMHSVLEHLQDPVEMVDNALTRLAPGGRLCIAVPDERNFLEKGEVSMLFSEHYSYFTSSSLEKTLRLAGATDVKIENSSFSALLYAFCVPGGDRNLMGESAHPSDCNLAYSYPNRVREFLEKFSRYLESIRSDNRTLGIYVPGRAVNALVMCGAPLHNLRFFDDAPMLWGSYFPGLGIPIENRSALLNEPPSELLIMSLAFGSRIQNALRASTTSSLKITQVSTF